LEHFVYQYLENGPQASFKNALNNPPKSKLKIIDKPGLSSWLQQLIVKQFGLNPQD